MIVAVPVPAGPLPIDVVPLLTLPPFSTVKVPVPWPPIVICPALVQVASLTVTPPVLPSREPTVALVSVTVAPLEIVNLPVPDSPTTTVRPAARLEPGPVTVPVPDEPALVPKVTFKAFTVLPPETFSVPVPVPPMRSRLLSDQADAPLTVTVAVEPRSAPTLPKVELRTPPPWIVSADVPLYMLSVEVKALPPLITVGFGLFETMLACVALFGTPLSQLPAVYQSEEFVPIQAVAAVAVDGSIAIPTSAVDPSSKPRKCGERADFGISGHLSSWQRVSPCR